MYKSILIVFIFIFTCNFAFAAVTDQEVEDLINGLSQEQLDRIHEFMAESGLTREDMIEIYKIQKEIEEKQSPEMTLEEFYSKKKTDETALVGASQGIETTDPSIQGNGQTATPGVLSEIRQTPSTQPGIDTENISRAVAPGLQEKPLIAEPEKSGIMNQSAFLILLFVFGVLNFLLTLSILLAKKKEVFTIKT